MAKKKKKKTALAAALEKMAKKSAQNKKAKKQVVQKKPEKKNKVEVTKKAVKKSGVVISEKSAQKKREEKKKTNRVEATKKAIEKGQQRSALGTKVEKKTGTVNVQGENGKTEKVKYEYTPMTMQEYGQLEVGARTGQLQKTLKSNKDLNKKVTDLNVKDYAESPGVMGALDQMTQGLSVSEDPTYKYSESQKKIIDSQKKTGKYNVGRAVGAVAEFGLGGTGTVGSSIAKTAGKTVLKEAAEQGGKKLAKQTAKNIAKETAGDTVASLGLNTLDAVKFSYEDGKLNKEKFAKELALNVGGDILIGGTVSGIVHGLSARQVSNFNRINKALQKGEKVSDAEIKFYNKHVKELGDKVEAKVKQENEQQATKPSDAVDKGKSKNIEELEIDKTRLHSLAKNPDYKNDLPQINKRLDEVQSQINALNNGKAEKSTVANSATSEQIKAGNQVETTPQTVKSTNETTSTLANQVDELRKAGRTDDEIVETLERQGVSPYKAMEAVDGGVDDVVQPKVDVENRSYELHENKNLKNKGGYDYKPRGNLNGWSYAINRRYNGDVSITWWKGKEKHQSVFEPYTTNAEALYDFTDFLAKKELGVEDAEWKATVKQAAENPGKQYDTAKERIFDENKSPEEWLEKSKRIEDDELPRARQTAKKLVNQADDDVAELKDKYNWSYEDIEKGLKNIIEDNGKENNAVSKRLEFLIDERLRNGYDDFQYGERIPGNDEYMALLRDKEISAYDDEAFNQWARSLDAGDADIPQTAPKQTLSEEDIAKIQNSNASSFNAKKPTASDVRAAYENQKKGNFTVSENDMKFSETLWKSESCTDDTLRAELKEDVEKGLFGKKQDVSNNEALEIGRQKVQQDAKGETEVFVNKVEEGQKLKKQDFATATELLIHYKNTGDVANWKKVALAMAKGYSDAGQILQSARMVRRLTPEGRATQVLKLAETIKKDFTKNRGKDIDITVKDETIERILNAETEADLNNAFKLARIEIWNQTPASFMEKLQALQRMSMLGNPKTMLRNVAGNLIFKPFRAMSGTIETGFQKMGTKQLAKLDGGRTKKLVKAEDKEMYRGFKQTADEMFDDIYEQFGGSNSYAESYGRPHEANIFNNNSGKAASAVSSKIKGSTRISKSIKNALDYIEQKGMTQTAHNIIMGGLEKGDLLILKPEFKHSFAQFCYARGLNPSTMTKVQLEEAVEHAMNDAKYATFRNDSALASLISRKQGEWMTKKGATGLQTLAYRTGAGIVQTMIPFKKTPINIAKIGLDYSPLNIARGIYHNIEAVKKTGNADLLLQSYKEMASGLTGSAVFGLGMLLYSTGAVTVKAGNWSTDEWYDKEMGNQDYSLKIGDYTYSLSWCAPLNMPFIMGAAFQEYLEDRGGSLEAGLNMANGMVDSFLELSFAQSMKNFLTENETIEDYLVDLSVMPLQYASQLVPTMSSQFATILDDWQRDTTSYADGSLEKAWQKELKKNINKIPVLREKFLQPKIVGRTGEEVPSSAFDNIVAKTLATFLSTANIKEITMDANDRYLIEQLQATDDEDTREKLLPPSGGYFAGRVDDVKATPEQRTKYQKARGKEYQKLVSEQRTAKYQDVLTLEQKQSKLVKTKWAAVSLADAKTYGYKYALKAEDLRNTANGYEAKTMADFKLFKTANPNKTAKDYFNAYYSIKTTRIHAGDSEYSTDGLALYKAGADDNTYRHFGIDIEKKNVFKNYLKEYGGSEDEYYYATNAIQRKATENNGGTVNNVIKVMTLAEQNAPDRVYYAVGVLGDDNDQMNLGRGLLAEGFTVADIVSYKANSQAYNEDGKGPLRKEEAIAYVESLGLKSQRQKALIFATLSSANNPFGSIGAYTLDGDVMGAASSSSSGSGRGNGRGSSRKESSSLPSWEEYAKNYVAEQTATEQPQVEAYVNPVSWEDYVQDYISKAPSGGGTVKASKGNTGTSYQKKISSIIDKMEV